MPALRADVRARKSRRVVLPDVVFSDMDEGALLVEESTEGQSNRGADCYGAAPAV
jgi:hypothetical protein